MLGCIVEDVFLGPRMLSSKGYDGSRLVDDAAQPFHTSQLHFASPHKGKPRAHTISFESSVARLSNEPRQRAKRTSSSTSLSTEPATSHALEARIPSGFDDISCMVCKVVSFLNLSHTAGHRRTRTSKKVTQITFSYF